MFLFTTNHKQYALTASVFFWLTLGSYFYSFRVCDLVCGRNANNNRPLCCATIAAGFFLTVGSAVVALWRYLPSSSRPFLECILSLVGTMPGGFTSYALVKVLVYAETIQLLCHIRELSLIPITIAACLKNETIHSSQLIHNSSVFQPEHMNQVNTGVIDIITKFNEVNGTQRQFRNAVEIGYRWLESRGFGCQQVLTRPFALCLNATKEAKKDCLLRGAEGLCDIVDISEEICWKLMILSKGPCQHLGPERITEMLASFRQRLGSLASGVIRMRVGILFELHLTSNVGDKLSKAWTRILESLRDTGELIRVTYDITVNYVLKLVAMAGLLVWPVSYLCYYLCGPLSFDNFYITKAEYLEIRGLEEMAEKDEQELQIVPAWIPTVKETIRMIWDVFFAADQLMIVAFLLVDFYYTNWINDLHVKWLEMFHNFRTNIFDKIGQPDETTGVGFIGEMVVQQLEKLQEAIGFNRLLSCIRPAPPATYSQNIFFIALAQKAVYVFVQTKLRYIPSFICARFYRRRHYLRMSYLKAKLMMRPLVQTRHPVSRCCFALYLRRKLSTLFVRLRGPIRKTYHV
ncbi:hypothetical protein GHT06_016691 [Daphnia sinensis]|uniref:Dendritic cell-specific transmembrane protein-like domain-containing protein n=1 Tax=Daphnia sinensis TaxID=1820382 RepID=A0AAD5KQL3_9CRUS|nr:hypothetical protein GHT06_016691 [Daphnia sinensis]